MAVIASNTFASLNPEMWKPMVQDYLNALLVANKICNVKCEALLSSGDQVNFPYINDVRVQNYTPGTELTIDSYTSTQDSLIVDQSKVATVYIDPQEEKQALARYAVSLAKQSAFQLSQNIDQSVIAEGITSAANTITGGTLAAADMFQLMTNAYSTLFRNNAMGSPMFALIDPEREALISQNFVANGFQVADNTLRNGFRGAINGFNVYVTNNLPYAQSFTMDTQPTANDTIRIAGVTWTFVASGTAANPGEISRGANLAAAQANLVDAINGTGTPGAGTYIDVSVNNRRIYQNSQVAAAAFTVGNVMAVTAFGRISGAGTMTAGTNVWGTETSNLLFGTEGAISMAIQMQPELYEKPEPRMLGKNYLTHTLYGKKVFYRDTFRLVKASINA